MLQPSTILGKKILVLTAHPDDESFLAAGTIHANSQAGGQTFLVCATLGEKGASHLEEELDAEKLAEIRHQELHNAATELNISYTKTLRYPDGKVDEYESALLADASAVGTEIMPEVIMGFGPDGITGHKDHIAVSRVAAKLAAQYKLPLAMFCIPHEVGEEAQVWLKKRRKTTGHYDDDCASFQKENITIPIDGEIKLKALRCYCSQIDKQDPFHGFPESISKQLLKQECFYLQSPK